MSGPTAICPSPTSNEPKPSGSQQWTGYTLYYDGGNENLQPSRHNLYGAVVSRDALATHSHLSDFDSEIASSKDHHPTHQQQPRDTGPISAASESSQDSFEPTQGSASTRPIRQSNRRIHKPKNLNRIRKPVAQPSTETLAPGYYHNLSTGQEIYVISGRQYRTRPCPPASSEIGSQLGTLGSASSNEPSIAVSKRSLSSAIYPTRSPSRQRLSFRTTKTQSNARMDAPFSSQSLAVQTITQQAKEFETLQEHFKSAKKPSGKSLTSLNAHISVKQSPASGRRVFLVRSGERMDRIFGSRWLLTSFTDSGNYLPFDMNQPLTIPERPGGPAEYFNDAPLTEIGSICSQMLGRGLRLREVRPELIICSPALRAVQTANGIVIAYDPEGTLGLKICVEPGFYDFLQWYHEVPQLLTPKQLTEVGFPIDMEYDAVLPLPHLHMWKSEQMCHLYDRQRVVLANVLHRHSKTHDIIIVGHGVTMDACGRQLIHGDSTYPHASKLEQLGIEYPYTSVVGTEELEDGHWRMMDHGAPRISYLDYDNRINPEFFNRSADN